MGRRKLITGSAGVLAVLGTTAPTYAAKGVAQRRHRIGLPSGVQSGDVTAPRGGALGPRRRRGAAGRPALLRRAHRPGAARAARERGERLHRPARPDRADAGSLLRGGAVVRGPRRHAGRGRARQLPHRARRAARDVVRLDRRHRRPGLGDQPRPRRDDRLRRDAPHQPGLLRALRRHRLLRRRDPRGGGRARRPGVAQPGHPRGGRGRRVARRVPRPAPLQPDGPQRPGDVRRRARRRAVGRPRDAQQLVPRPGPRRRALHRAPRRRARRAGAPGLAGVPADRHPGGAPARAATGSPPPGSTARSSAGRCSTSSASTCAPSSRPTPTGLEPAQHADPRRRAGRLAGARGGRARAPPGR